jgi:hypothetical protein
MVDVIATERGYFGSARREPGERFSLPDTLWKDEARRPKWVRLAGGKTEPATRKPAAKPAKPPEPTGNGVQDALGGPAPDWLPPEPDSSSQPAD